MNPRILRSELVNNVLGQGDDLLKVGRGRHLEPGVVAYDNEDGSKITYLLTREAIEAMRPTAKGIPLVGSTGDFDHVKINAQDAARGKYDGTVIESYAGPEGWEYVLFQINDPATAEKCAEGYELSCAYIPTDVDETPGVWHNVPYDAIIRNGQYTHVAVVPNPRYEGATIELLNSKGGIVNKALKSILAALVPAKQLREIVNSIEADEKAKTDALEKANADKKAQAQTAFDEAMKNAKTEEEKAAAKAAFEKANADLAAPKADLPPEPLGGGDVTPEPGMPAQGVKKNDVPAESAKEGESQAQETAEQKVARENAAAAAKAAEDKAALEKKNAEEAAAKKAAEEKAEQERVNSLELKNRAEAQAKKDAERRERFNALKRDAEERGGTVGSPFVGIISAQEKADLGRDRYGSRK